MAAGQRKGKRIREEEVREGRGEPITDMSLEGVTKVVEASRGAQRQRLVATRDILREDEIYAGPGVHSAGYFLRKLRKEPVDGPCYENETTQGVMGGDGRIQTKRNFDNTETSIFTYLINHMTIF